MDHWENVAKHAAMGGILGVVWYVGKKWIDDAEDAAERVSGLLSFAPEAFGLDPELTRSFLDLQRHEIIAKEHFMAAGDRADAILFAIQQVKNEKVIPTLALVTCARQDFFQCIFHLKQFLDQLQKRLAQKHDILVSATTSMKAIRDRLEKHVNFLVAESGRRDLRG